MILDKLRKQDNFTETDKTIANYLLKEENKVIGLTSLELGKLTYTSQAAVVRFYKKLGFENYRIFKAVLQEEISDLKKIHQIDKSKPIGKDMSVDDIIITVTKYYINQIYESKISIDKNQIQRLYNRLRNADIVEIYSIGIASSYIAKQLANKLAAFGMRCVTIETESEFHLKNNKFDERVAIIISLEDFNNIDSLNVDGLANKLKKDRSYIFGILIDEDTLGRICHDYVIASTKVNEQNLNNFYGAMYIIDIIYSMFLTHFSE